MDYKSVLLEEYAAATPPHQDPIYCMLGKEKVIVPQIYHGDKDTFLDNLFSFQDELYKEYDKHNTQYPDNRVEPALIRAGEAYIFPPLEATLKLEKISQEAKNKKDFETKTNKVIDAVIKKSLSTAMRKYRSTVKKTLRARREYPDKQIPVSMAPDNLKQLNRLHQRYCLQKMGIGLQKTFKWSAEQTANILAGVTGALPATAYFLLDKKLKFSKFPKARKFIDEKALPYIRKGALKSAILATMVFGGKKLMDSQFVDNTPQDEIKNEKIININNNDSLPRYTITDAASFQQLYDAAFPLMIQSMMPTEVLITTPYTDNGRTVNTIGLGSYWYPENGDPKSKDWIHTSSYVKNHQGMAITGKMACALADGWFRNREGGRIFKLMQKELKGASLNINEFTAIATCMYNSETSGRALCKYVRDNYKDPIKCAAYLGSLKPQNASFEDGISKRHLHEVLIYLNVDNYVESLPSLLVKKGVNSKGVEYHVTSVTQLKPDECQQALSALSKGKTEGITNLSHKIRNYVCKGGKTVAQIAHENGIEGISTQAINFEDAQRLTESNKMYAEALAHYDKKDYEKALKGFQDMVAAGFNGADIHNDLAITYYNLGEYDKCIAECREVLKTGETEQYAPANYNAGKAYEKKGNISKALENYQLASQREPSNKTYKKAVQRSRDTISQIQNTQSRQKAH